MPPKAGRGRRKKLAGKYTQKRKPEETEHLEVQEHSTDSPTREKKGRKCNKYVGPCPTKTPERSPEGSRSPQQSQESRLHSTSPPPPRNRHPESSDDEGKYLELIFGMDGGRVRVIN